MRRVVVILLVAGLLIHSPVGVHPIPEVFGSEWDRTGLRLAHVPISSNVCYRTEGQFIGCLAALDAAAQFLDPKQTLVTRNGYTRDTAYYRRVIGEYGRVLLVERKKISLTRFQSGRELVRLSRELKRQQPQDYPNLFLQNLGGRLTPFDAIFACFRSLIVHTEKESTLAAAMINALLAHGDDPHAHIRPAELDERYQAMMGIEANVEMVGGYPVIQPMRHPKAEADDLQGYDVVLAVNGRPVNELEQLAGRENAPLEVDVLRDGAVLSFAIASESFELRSVASERIQWQGKAWGYIRIGRFSDDRLCVKLEKAIRELDAAQVNVLVVDVRGNLGGYLDQAVCAAGLFVGRQIIALERKDGYDDLHPLRG